MFRLIYFTHYRRIINEDVREGKYELTIFDNRPNRYLAYLRRDKSEREWVRRIMESGVHNITFDLSEEPNTIRKIFGEFKDVKMLLEVKNTVFEPVCDLNDGNHKLFYGYLNQILSYRVIVDGKELWDDSN